LDARRAAEHELQVKRLREQSAQAKSERERRIRGKGWPNHFTEAVLRKEVLIGMTAEMVRDVWGNPSGVNTTINAAGKSEQ
jgi:hypothetical protein